MSAAHLEPIGGREQIAADVLRAALTHEPGSRLIANVTARRDHLTHAAVDVDPRLRAARGTWGLG